LWPYGTLRTQVVARTPIQYVVNSAALTRTVKCEKVAVEPRRKGSACQRARLPSELA
jgi:hypothetical protein